MLRKVTLFALIAIAVAKRRPHYRHFFYPAQIFRSDIYLLGFESAVNTGEPEPKTTRSESNAINRSVIVSLYKSARRWMEFERHAMDSGALISELSKVSRLRK